MMSDSSTLRLPSTRSSIVSYVTDVEGNLDYWNRFISRSPAIFRNSDDSLSLNDNYYFVYGGDICDRGVGDIRICRDLLQLKQSYPDRVQIILGNRDVNKLRLLSELNSTSVSSPPSVYWFKPKVTMEPGVEVVSESKGSKEAVGIDDVGCEELKEAADAVDRLKWILVNTMGSPQAFELRRTELIELGLPSSDEAVLKSFTDLVQPNGVLTTLISHGKIGCIIGDVLFIHGGLNALNRGFVPPSSRQGSDLGIESSPQKWINRLNLFAKSEIQDYIVGIDDYMAASQSSPPSYWASVGGYGHEQPGGNLIMYGMGSFADGSPNPSVIYTNFLKGGSPYGVDEEIASWLLQNGIKRVISGHQPHGDCPLLIDRHDLQIIACDTSYASNTQYHDEEGHPYVLSSSALEQLRKERHTDGTETSDLLTSSSSSSSAVTPNGVPSYSSRGVAVGEILITIEDDKSIDFRVQGLLADGIVYDYQLPESNYNRHLGRETPDGWWMKAKVSGIGSLLSKSEGYTVKNVFIAEGTEDLVYSEGLNLK